MAGVWGKQSEAVFSDTMNRRRLRLSYTDRLSWKRNRNSGMRVKRRIPLCFFRFYTGWICRITVWENINGIPMNLMRSCRSSHPSEPEPELYFHGRGRHDRHHGLRAAGIQSPPLRPLLCGCHESRIETERTEICIRGGSVFYIAWKFLWQKARCALHKALLPHADMKLCFVTYIFLFFKFDFIFLLYSSVYVCSPYACSSQ